MIRRAVAALAAAMRFLVPARRVFAAAPVLLEPPAPETNHNLFEDIRRQILNTPEFRSFADAVVLEAQHQRERWGVDHDAGKGDGDWLWLLGYLSNKALFGSVQPGDDPTEKKLHRIITIAAAAANWHAQVLGKSNMRPGIAPPPEAQHG